MICMYIQTLNVTYILIVILLLFGNLIKDLSKDLYDLYISHIKQ